MLILQLREKNARGNFKNMKKNSNFFQKNNFLTYIFSCNILHKLFLSDIMKEQYTYIDLFSGAGGLSLGFNNAGFYNLFSVEIEKQFCNTYAKNFPDHNIDIKNLTKSEIMDLINKSNVDVIIGGTPCQGFSIAGNPGRTFLDDPRNHLFKEFARIVKIIQPKIFLIENVARLYNHNKGKTRLEIINEFTKLGYHVECKLFNMADFGVPQYRRRIVFIGSKSNKEIIFPQPTYIYTTIKDAINNLPKLNSGCHSNIPNHIAMNHTEEMLNKMSYIKDGGNRLEIPEHIRPKKGDARKYIRYNSSKPSICITGDMRKVFHYNQNRALTVRELARVQSFPDNFIFTGSSISQQQQVGNAVPPLFAELLANSIRDMLNA